MGDRADPSVAGGDLRLLRRALEHMQMLAAGIERREIPSAPLEPAQNRRPFIGRHLSLYLRS
jgi:hypothetical protein